jgi:glycosyltransferase involved in cell wall biosynthesis
VKRFAVVTSSPPATEGGHLVIGRALTRALQDAGHDAAFIVTPDYGFGRNLASYRANWCADVGRVDQVISFRHPSYAVRHRPHVCWLNHTIREYYDLWPRFSAALSPLNRVKEAVRRASIHAADSWLLRHHVDCVVAQSATIQSRLVHDFGISANVVWPPPPQRPYRCDRYGDFVLVISRLVPLKRVDLIVRALAEAPARQVRAVVVGDGEGRADLIALADALGVTPRIAFLGHVGEPEMLDCLARCRIVCFAPLAEDYGFVTVEAFASCKGVITCADSGGPGELVADGVTGLVTEPTPAALAIALARAMDDPPLAERLGAAGKAVADALSWSATVERLVIV